MHSSVLAHVTPEIKFFSMLGNLDSKTLFGQILSGTRINVVTAGAKLEMGERRLQAQPLNLYPKIYYTIFGIR